MTSAFIHDTPQQRVVFAAGAIAQVPDDKLHIALDENTNSIAVIMKHVAGNLLSRWTDFLTTDGEKPERDRRNNLRVSVREQVCSILD